VASHSANSNNSRHSTNRCGKAVAAQNLFMAATLTSSLSLVAAALDSATITTATIATITTTIRATTALATTATTAAVVCYSHWLLAMLIVMAKEPTATAIAKAIVATTAMSMESSDWSSEHQQYSIYVYPEKRA